MPRIIRLAVSVAVPDDITAQEVADIVRVAIETDFDQNTLNRNMEPDDPKRSTVGIVPLANAIEED